MAVNLFLPHICFFSLFIHTPHSYNNVCFQITIKRTQGTSSSFLSNFTFQQRSSVNIITTNNKRAFVLIDYYSEFVAKNYVGIKQANPELPILVREASGIEARAFARFGNIKRTRYVDISLSNIL